MIFANGHYRGAFLASEIVHKVEGRYQDQRREIALRRSSAKQGQLTGLVKDDSAHVVDIVHDLGESIWDKCKGQRLTRDEVYLKVWDDWFGDFGAKHLNAALRGMASDGRIEDHDGAFSRPKDWFKFADEY